MFAIIIVNQLRCLKMQFNSPTKILSIKPCTKDQILLHRTLQAQYNYDSSYPVLVFTVLRLSRTPG